MLHPSPSRIVSKSIYCVRSPNDICSVDWAQLAIVDLAKAKTPECRAEQVQIARDAMHKQGFFYVVNHGFDLAQVNAVPFIAIFSQRLLEPAHA
jgi:hypothetical protein